MIKLSKSSGIERLIKSQSTKTLINSNINNSSYKYSRKRSGTWREDSRDSDKMSQNLWRWSLSRHVIKSLRDPREDEIYKFNFDRSHSEKENNLCFTFLMTNNLSLIKNDLLGKLRTRAQRSTHSFQRRKAFELFNPHFHFKLKLQLMNVERQFHTVTFIPLFYFSFICAPKLLIAASNLLRSRNHLKMSR